MKAKYEEYITKSLDKDLQDKIEFGMLLSLIREKSIKNTDELSKYLDEEVDICRNWLANNKAGTTINRVRREYTKKLEDLELMKKLVERLK